MCVTTAADLSINWFSNVCGGSCQACSRHETGRAPRFPKPFFRVFLACLANGYTASDGDFFTYFFKQYKLGPVVGERTWGGVRGIRGYTH